MMQTIKIYLIHVYETNIWYEEGTRFSLTPWGENTREYKGEDDGGKEYYLPDGYEAAQDRTGRLQIYHGEICWELTTRRGKPCC